MDTLHCDGTVENLELQFLLLMIFKSLWSKVGIKARFK